LVNSRWLWEGSRWGQGRAQDSRGFFATQMEDQQGLEALKAFNIYRSAGRDIFA
jgi:hypothetical protein